MDKKELKKKLSEIGNTAANSLGYELVDVEIEAKQDHLTVLFIIHKEGGVSIDDCTEMSHFVEKEIDQGDLISKSYSLEVSSPGLDRPLKTLDDYRRNKNKLVDVHLYSGIDGVKDFRGTLESYDEHEVTLKLESGEKQSFPRNSISMMRQTILI